MKENALLAATILDAVSFLWESSGIRNGYIPEEDMEATLNAFSNTFQKLKKFDEEISKLIEEVSAYSLRLEETLKDLHSFKDKAAVQDLLHALTSHKTETDRCLTTFANSQTIYKACEKMLSFKYYHDFSRSDIKEFYNKLCSENQSSEQIQASILDLANYIRGCSKDWITTRQRSPSQGTKEDEAPTGFWSHSHI
ncbi:MAG: archaellum component FlaC [Chlamydiales bacterium]|jgi:archaellum component FlaC